MSTPDQKLARHAVRLVKRYNRLAVRAERKAMSNRNTGFPSIAEAFQRQASDLRVQAAQYAAQVHVWQQAQQNAEESR